MWSTARATEGEVSDVYVRLGYEFNIACRAFNAIGVDTSDLGPVPDMLRTILEETLSQEANQQSLEKYLPRIRDIIINLLHGLKKKQQRLRQRSNREGGEASRPPRQASTASTMSVASNLTEQLEDVPSRHTSNRSFAQRQGSGDLAGQDHLPPRTTSHAGGRTSPQKHGLSPQNSTSNSHSRQGMASTDSSSSMSSSTAQSIPVIAPYPETETMPSSSGYEQDPPPHYERERPSASPEPPKPPPKANDALTALQRGGELERRASRRFSAYQIQKHLGTSMNGIPAIPAAQNSPIPNRGRDVRESLNAVRSRGSVLHSRARSRTQKNGFENSPNRDLEVKTVSEESASQQDEFAPPSKPFASQQPESPLVKTPEDKLGPSPYFPSVEESVGATVNGPIEEPFAPDQGCNNDESTPALKRQSARTTRDYTPPVSQYVSEGSPQPGKELTLFLQYKSKIKKFVLSDGADLSIPRLQLAFIEKFAWNTHNNGVDLPEIYIQDAVSGVRHELEDLSDIKERSVLVLNVEALDEVKRHFDDGIGSLRRIVEGIRTSVDDQHSTIQRISDRQQETAKELASIAAAPQPAAPAAPTTNGSTLASKDTTGQLKEVQSLRRDLAVVRQTYTSFVSDMQASMATLKTKAASVKQTATHTPVPVMDNNTGRAYVNTGKKSLSDDSESIVNRVDDLQDLVEDLRKDVVTRGVRPLPRQLEDVSRDISVATSDLKKLQEFLRKEKPIWTKIWEKELQVVCDDRDLLTMQEELAADLEDDLDKAAQTFALVEQATKQQNLASPTGTTHVGSRSSSRTLLPVPTADPAKAKDSVLGEVRALQPNHESRLEAIERAEKARQKELENRREGEFQKELGNFVEEGKLKKSGGVEEVERQRKQREERTRREIWERQQARAKEQAEKEAAAAAEAQAQAASAGNNENENEPPAREEAAPPDGEDQPPPVPEKDSPPDKDDASSNEEVPFVEASEEAPAP